jgi:hypothetical protein
MLRKSCSRTACHKRCPTHPPLPASSHPPGPSPASTATRRRPPDRCSASRSNSSFFCASVVRLLINAQSTASLCSFSKYVCMSASPLLPSNSVSHRRPTAPPTNYDRSCGSLIARQLPLSPMMFFARRFEDAFDMAVQCLHDADPRQHGRPAFRRDQDQGLHRRLPFRGLRARPWVASGCRSRHPSSVTSSRPSGKGIGSSNGRFQPFGAIRQTSRRRQR